MEGFKDVIVSQPPAMYSKSAYTTSISLENYKGILLCDRPTGLAGSAIGGGSGGFADGKTFTPANPTGNPVGLGPSLESQAHREQREAVRLENLRRHRTQSHQVLSKHRRWLHSFAQQMKHMHSADREREVEAAQRVARLRQAEAQKRNEQCADTAAAVEGTTVERAPYNPTVQLEPFPRTAGQATVRCPDCGCCSAVGGTCERKAALQTQSQGKTKSKAAATQGGNASRKPKWAMTEDEALDDELGMNDDLLDFAKNLDYDRFVSDMEVAEALAVMRDRVVEIANANHWSADDLLQAAHHDTDDDLASTVALSEMDGLEQQQQRHAGLAAATTTVAAAAEARAAMAAGVTQHGKAWDASRGRVLKRAISKDALALAERLLAASPSMQKVHTKQSLARLLQRAALEGDTSISQAALLSSAANNKLAASPARTDLDVKLGADLAAATAIGPLTGGVEPKVVVVHPEAAVGADSNDPYDQPRVLREMQMSKERTQGLPYLYRCPAL